MLRLLILLTLFKAESEATETRAAARYSIQGVRGHLATLLSALEKAHPNQKYFSLSEFDATILQMFEYDEIEYVENHLSIPKHSAVRLELRRDSFLRFLGESCKHIPFESEDTTRLPRAS